MEKASFEISDDKYEVEYKELSMKDMVEMSKGETLTKKHDVAEKRMDEAQTPDELDLWANVAEKTGQEMFEVPLSLYEKCVTKLTKNGEIVSDPGAGVQLKVLAILNKNIEAEEPDEKK